MKLLEPIKLLLPALIPSWNFFDVISHSPRIQYVLLASEDENPKTWIEFRPRPQNISLVQAIKRMLWNPKWNESLFLVSCAERLVQNYTKHSENEIFNRIILDVNKSQACYLQFRLLFIERQDSKIKEEVLFTSQTKKFLNDDVL